MAHCLSLDIEGLCTGLGSELGLGSRVQGGIECMCVLIISMVERKEKGKEYRNSKVYSFPVSGLFLLYIYQASYLSKPEPMDSPIPLCQHA